MMELTIKDVEIIALLNGLKPVVRQGYAKEELTKIKGFCKEKNLYCVVSPLKTVIVDEGFSNKGILVDADDDTIRGREIYFVYMSKDESLANKALLSELNHDDRALGEFLGYPKCCIEFFDKMKEKRKEEDFNLERDVLENSKNNRYPHYMNIFMRENNICILSHFPCSLDCKESQRYGEKLSRIVNIERLKGILKKHGRIIEFY